MRILSATFYRNFKDKYDLIAWDHTRNVAEIMSRIGDGYSWKETLADGANWFHSEKSYLTNLLQHTSGHDSFVKYMSEINCEALKKHILAVCGRTTLSEKEELLIRTYCLGTVCLTCEWLLGKHNATPRDMAELYESALPEPLKQLLI